MEDSRISLLGLLEALVGPKGDLPILDAIPQPPVIDGHLLIGQEDLAPLLAPADDARKTSFTEVAFSGKGELLLFEGLGHRQQTQEDQGLEED